MRKNVVMVLLVIITLFSVVYSLFQQTGANKARIEAEANLVLAKTAQSEAEKLGAVAVSIRKMADQATSNADYQIKMLREELDKCKGKK